jgi:esterase/lipase superfamily enzyme
MGGTSLTTTVYFATNRKVTNAQDAIHGYTSDMVSPMQPDELTYGAAMVDGIDLSKDQQGTVISLSDVSKMDFSAPLKVRMSATGTDLLIFIHGFDNSFSDAITRAALNREWLAASRLPSTDTTVVAFSWPSLGDVLGFPPDRDYKADRSTAQNSGAAIMTFLSRLEQVITKVRRSGGRATLLAHSMGNLALEAGVETWFLDGNGSAPLFDLAILAAGDCRYDTFDQPITGGMIGLTSLAEHTSVYYSRADRVLQLSNAINGLKRLGQDGPQNRADQTEFPPERYMMNDCSNVDDYTVGFLTSHQYYRLSSEVRAHIAAQMAGPQIHPPALKAAPGVTMITTEMSPTTLRVTPSPAAAASAIPLLSGFDAARDCGKVAGRIQAAKVSFVARYYSHSAGKNLTASEAQLLGDAGVLLVSVWESQGDQISFFTRQQGVDDGTSAYNMATLVGQPTGTPIYFAVDCDPGQSELNGAIVPYFQGVAAGFNTIGHGNSAYTAGVYGSGFVCESLVRMGLVTHTWLSNATGWAGSKTYQDWHIRQQLPGDPYGLGFKVDPDDAKSDFGGFSVARQVA